MENEPTDPEVIRQRMQETRTHLTEKVEAVEDLVTNTVKSTAEAVTETVEEVKEAVSGTVEGVKEVVHETVEEVRSAFDFRAHFENHPWLMLAGVTGLSFLATKLAMGRGHRRDFETCPPSTGYTSAGSYEAPRYAEPSYEVTPAYAASAPSYSTPSAEPSSARSDRREERPGWLSSLAGKLGPSANKIKEMGIGYTLGLIDHMVSQALPDNLRGGVHDIVKTLTTSLGGKPMDEWPSSSSNGSGRTAGSPRATV